MTLLGKIKYTSTGLWIYGSNVPGIIALGDVTADVWLFGFHFKVEEAFGNDNVFSISDSSGIIVPPDNMPAAFKNTIYIPINKIYTVQDSLTLTASGTGSTGKAIIKPSMSIV